MGLFDDLAGRLFVEENKDGEEIWHHLYQCINVVGHIDGMVTRYWLSLQDVNRPDRIKVITGADMIYDVGVLTPQRYIKYWPVKLLERLEVNK